METSYYRPKSADQLTFTDNGMFQAVLHEPGVCAELVERLLGIKVKKVEYPELEKTIAPYYISKGVRLDVYLKDEDKVIDVEMIWRVSCQYQRTKKGQFQSLTGFDHYDIRGFNKLSYPRSMVRRKLLHYANGNQFYRKIQLS